MTPLSIQQRQDDFGERLKQVLVEAGDSRQKAANRMGEQSVTLGNWIRGRAPYSIIMLQKLQEQYGVDLNYLITGEKK